MTEKILKDSEGMPDSLTMVERKRVKKVKLKINPVITPIGLALPISVVPIEEDRMIGKIGRMQGERIVTTPAKNAKTIKRII